MSDGFRLNSIELQEYQPNRYPFLMIDVVDWVIPGKSACGYKNLTMNEWYFPQHFPGHPNMPGALQLEALAQMLTVAVTTQIETEILSWRRGICRGRGIGRTNGDIACEADMTIAVPDVLDQFLPKSKS